MARPVSLLMLLLCVGCGSDLSHRPISWEEGWDLIAFLGDETFFTAAGEMRDRAGLGNSPPPEEPTGPYQLEIASSRACNVEGVVANHGIVEGVYDTAAQTVSGSGTLTKTFASCVQGTSHDQYAIDEGADIAITHSIELDEQQFTLSADMSLVGTLDWSALRDRSGTCSLDVEVETTVLDEALRTVRGVFCDHEYDSTVPWVPLYGG